VHRSAQETRASLWARYDEGGLGSDELDARLRAVDRAGDDPLALERALAGPVRVTSPGRKRWLGIIAAVAACALLVVGAVALLDEPDDTGDARGPTTGGGDPVPLPLPVPPPIDPEPVDCPELDDAVAAVEAIADNDSPANPAPLSEPPALPDGYTVADEVTLVPGSDPELSMNIAAGNPLPVDIVARALTGELTVTMRSFTYESAEAAAESGLSVIDDAICTYAGVPYAIPEHPGVTGSTISGIIPTTAFANWRLGERRFTVSVVAAIDGDPEAAAAAEALAGTIAALELEAAQTAP
jgi:hypothetical protein